jgi:hypothetical protein
MKRIAILTVLAVLASACGEEEEPACCAIQPKHQCWSDMIEGGATPAEMDIIQGPVEPLCPSEVLSEARLAELQPIWAESAACRTVGRAGRLSAGRSRLCETKGVSDLEDDALPAGVTPAQAADCVTGLAARGLKENEIWLMLQAPAVICPSNGVSETRIREVIANDWAPAGCMHFTNAQMLEALDTGACGGNAG